MAQVRFNDVDFSGLRNENNNSNNFQVKFFSLKNDNDEAIVRIMHDSVDDFEILTTHEIRENGAYKGKVNCLRDPREDISKCPLCAANVPVQQRIYIHLIHYVRDEQGNIIPQAEVWERSVLYATKIKSYIDNYGPMSDIICKIIRHGRAGDQKTSYEIVPNLNKAVYTDEIYVKDKSLFEGYSAFGTVVQNRSYEDLATYVSLGHLPERKQQNNNAPQQTSYTTSYTPNSNAYTPNVASSAVPQTAYVPQNTPTNPTVPETPGYGQMGFGVNVGESAGLQRPSRTYY